jgi:hypothetical protein
MDASPAIAMTMGTGHCCTCHGCAQNLGIASGLGRKNCLPVVVVVVVVSVVLVAIVAGVCCFKALLLAVVAVFVLFFQGRTCMLCRNPTNPLHCQHPPSLILPWEQ